MKWTIKEYKQWIKVGQPINLLVTKLSISKSNIKSLKGIENLVNLTSLNGIENLTNLTKLNCICWEIRSI